jgi:hypothetical protein
MRQLARNWLTCSAMARHPTFIPLALWCALIAVSAGGCYSPTLPIPPPLQEAITVSPPDADGWVLVEGDARAMDEGDQAVIINRDSMYGWIVPVGADGFSVQVQAEPLDWLVISRMVGDEMSQSIQAQVPAE